MKPRRIKLIIDSSLENVSLIGSAVNKICSLIPLSKLEAYQTELCVVEACNNVIEHAYQYASNHEVEVVVSVHMDRIVFEICDTGRALKRQPKAALEFDPDDLQSLPEGGMGLYIMNNFMDKVAYQSVDGKNVLTLAKRFTNGATTSA